MCTRKVRKLYAEHPIVRTRKVYCFCWGSQPSVEIYRVHLFTPYAEGPVNPSTWVVCQSTLVRVVRGRSENNRTRKVQYQNIGSTARRLMYRAGNKGYLLLQSKANTHQNAVLYAEGPLVLPAIS